MYRDKTLQRLVLIALILTISAIFVAHAAAETIVSVDAPEYVLSNTFDVKIRIENVDELDSGQFHLIFDPNVVNVTKVVAGSLGDKTVEMKGMAYKRCDKNHGIGIIHVVFDIGDRDGASGSGIISTIRFEVTGEYGNCSFLNISKTPICQRPVVGFEEGELIPWGSDDEITANWVNGRVCIGDSSLFDEPTDSGDSPGTDNSTDSNNSAGTDNSTDSNTLLQDTPKAIVAIFVENRDDDELDVYLYIDGDYDNKYATIKKNKKAEFYKTRNLPEGVHTFGIEWYDYDTGKTYVKTEDHYVSGVTAVALRTDEHTEDDVDKLSAQVYVKNLDDDDLDEVHLYVDGKYKKCKSISSGSVGDYGVYEFKEDEDALHSFKIEWFDPGTDVTYEKIVRSYITGEEAVTLYVDKHTKEDIILFPEATPTPVSTSPESSSTSARTVKEPTPAPTKAQITELHTDPAPTGAMSQHLSATCTLLAFVAVLFVLMQIRRI